MNKEIRVLNSFVLAKHGDWTDRVCVETYGPPVLGKDECRLCERAAKGISRGEIAFDAV